MGGGTVNNCLYRLKVTMIWNQLNNLTCQQKLTPLVQPSPSPPADKIVILLF